MLDQYNNKESTGINYYVNLKVLTQNERVRIVNYNLVDVRRFYIGLNRFLGNSFIDPSYLNSKPHI